MGGLDRRTLRNLAQWIPYRHGGKLLLLLVLAVFVTLSLILSIVGTGGMPSNLPVLSAQTGGPPPPLPGPPMAGPFNGLLVTAENAQTGEFYVAGINVLDFDAEAQFFNPYPPTTGSWNYGFTFRSLGIPTTENTYYAMAIDSEGNWYHNVFSSGKSQILVQGTSDAIDRSEGGSNRLRLMVRGNKGWFYINDQLATTLDLSHLRQPGDVSVFAYRSVSGETLFEGFTVQAEVVPLGGPPMAGPFNGLLVTAENAQTGGFYFAGIDVLDFDAEAQFFNPYPPTRGSWRYGFTFRDLGDTYRVVLIDSDGNWWHEAFVSGELLDSGQGTSDAINRSEGGSNRLRLMVRGNKGWFYINDQLATTLDLSFYGQVGDVGVFAYRSVSGETLFEGFTVRDEAHSIAAKEVVSSGGPPVAGPFYGHLAHDEDLEIEEYPAKLNVQDFDAEVRFFNPYPTTRGSWSYGFIFRAQEDRFHVVVVNSEWQWLYYLSHLAQTGPVDQGTSYATDTSEGGSNRLRLVVRGNKGWFYINDQLATTLDLSAISQAGDVRIVTAYIHGTELPGEATRYKGFTVWGKEAVSEPDVLLFAADTDAFWSRFFTDGGRPYNKPEVVLHDMREGVVPTPCGTVPVDNAFYCQGDHSIHVFSEFLQQKFLPTGDFAVGFLLAHEWAHAAQQQLGILADSRLWNIQKELQADCLAGVYTDYAIFESDNVEIEPGDVQEAAISASLVGDPEGTPQDDPQAHGSSQQRKDAFYAGFNGGFAPCWQYTSRPGALSKKLAK